MDFITRSLSMQESRVVLALTELGRRETTRQKSLHFRAARSMPPICLLPD
jgi:hypothetical protein